MRNFLYRCPMTQLNVQATVTEEESSGREYVAQQCPACGGFHLINPLTGEGPKRPDGSRRSRRNPPSGQ